ncbi:MAG TPA: hypothetical protein VGB77_00965, partial [Abditibacteriaceae bacterium]
MKLFLLFLLLLLPTMSNAAEVKTLPLPDLLVMQNGTPVKSARQWPVRRAELLHLFEQEIYGKTLLGRPKDLRFVVREQKNDARGGKATRLRVGILFEGTETGRQMELLVYL